VKIAVAFGPLCLAFRGSFDFDNLWSDPKGLTGSELGFVRIAQELKKLGHTVELFTVATQTEWNGMRVRPWSESGLDQYDAAVAINEPDLLKPMRAKLRVAECWLNDFTFCKPGFEKHVDLFTSCSAPHLAKVLTDPNWRHVNVTPQTPRGAFVWEPNPAKWIVNELGCDPVAPRAKVPGRVVHTSSPDRGLHWLLQAWPLVLAKVPHATLKIFYRLEPWLRGFDNVAYFPPIEPLRQRTLFIEECLRRFKARGGMGITVCDSVSREQIAIEMAEAEVVAYPTDTTAWSEGWSCSTTEACAARACPVICGADALGDIYRGACPIVEAPMKDHFEEYTELLIRALTDPAWRDQWNDKAQAFAAEHTWAGHAKRLEAAIIERLPKWEPIGLVGT